MPPQTSNQTSSLEEALPLVSTAAVVPHRHAHLRSAVSAPGDRPPSQQQQDEDDDGPSSAPPPLPASDGGGAIPYSTPSSTPTAEAQGAGTIPVGTRSDLGAEHRQRDSTSGGDGTASAALPASSFGGATGREWSLTPGPGAMIAAAAGGGTSLTTALEAMEEDAAVAAATVEGEGGEVEVAKERASQPNDAVTAASEDSSAVAESAAPPPVRKSTEVLGGPTWSITPGPGALITAGRCGDNVWGVLPSHQCFGIMVFKWVYVHTCKPTPVLQRRQGWPRRCSRQIRTWI